MLVKRKIEEVKLNIYYSDYEVNSFLFEGLWGHIRV